MEPVIVRIATFGALCFVVLTSLPTSAQDPGCQKIRISGSTSLQTHLMTTYTIGNTELFVEGRPVYTSDTTDDRIYYVSGKYPDDVPYWFVGQYPSPGDNGLHVEDHRSLYANNIEGTFNIWDPEIREWKGAPYVQISCADSGYFGCFNAADHDSSVIDASIIPLGPRVTVEWCIEYCRNYEAKSIAALSNQDCICGSGVNHNSFSPKFCEIPCGGNSDQKCGGAGRADVYQTWVGVCVNEATTDAIYSPRYPGMYPPYQECTWEIIFEPDKVIKFYYNVWDVPTGDRLVITDKSGQSRILGPYFHTAWTNEVTVNFVSNNLVNGRFAVQYEAVDHCGGIGATEGIAQLFPSHGGNFAVGQQVTIRCTDGIETVVECLHEKIFNVTGPYCADSPEGEMTTSTPSTGTAAADDHAAEPVTRKSQ
ncbi:KREMEN1 [Branchiostoma lanceolatum]|uniref:KREMEN1 protein n=1 Tax=Branchiostoma lanceolatum TaxID=7740 RepID=A0A8K0A514_BRALA|nr:KREMEN1 [Branchiostoma lanceolatum]